MQLWLACISIERSVGAGCRNVQLDGGRQLAGITPTAHGVTHTLTQRCDLFDLLRFLFIQWSTRSTIRDPRYVRSRCIVPAYRAGKLFMRSTVLFPTITHAAGST